MFDILDLINNDGALLGLGGKQLLIESVHGMGVVLHDVPGVVIRADNPYASCLRVLILNERSFPSHVIDWLTHGAKIRGGERKGVRLSPAPPA